jgi:hypothetical protein
MWCAKARWVAAQFHLLFPPLLSHGSTSQGATIRVHLFPTKSHKTWCFKSCVWFFGKLLRRRGSFSWCLDLLCRSSWVMNDFFTGMRCCIQISMHWNTFVSLVSHNRRTPIANNIYQHNSLHLLKWGILVAKLN